MLKKLITFLLALVVGLQPLTATAADLSQAFGDLMSGGAAASVQKGGRYTSGARNVFVGGGVEMRFPTSKATLFSIAPPSFSAGCQGISAHFGGFSFISGDQIEQLVKNIAQGAPGLIINMVIKALCPMCEAVLQNMQKLAQFAAKTNLDSCRVATNLVNQLGSALDMNSSTAQDGAGQLCSSRGASVNADDGMGGALRGICKDMETAMTNMSGWWDSLEKGMYGTGGQPGDGAGKGGGGSGTKQNVNSEICSIGAGNCTWRLLAEIFRDRTASGAVIPGVNMDEVIGKRLMVMNLVGTTLMGKDASCGAELAQDPAPTNGKVQAVTCVPPLEPATAVGLFMCGNGDGIGEKDMLWRNYCGALFAKNNGGADPISAIKNIPIIDCSADGLADDTRYIHCNKVKISVVSDVPFLITGRGFLKEVQDLLQEAVTRVRTNQPMGADATGQKIITLINMAPYPLYQAINAAAVYPEAGQQLVDSLSLLVADHLAYAYFGQYLKFGNQAGAAVTMSPKMVDRLANGMNSLRMEADANRSRMGKTIASQQMLMEEIRKINVTIQQSVMTEQMLNMQKYAKTVATDAAAPSTPGN